ncbi:3415_t:CDS:2 [Ambispora gerdemannii]|uniref:3415_t:CDS:1 n=1 Tax=Ambispora gerdemannii TaxID=144530 RepID=A0A9N8ZUY4_9GLOM|nr:3415_t:CDS:2 [Ambispora gerdemannii]
MSVKLFVGGLSWTTDDRALRQKFEEHGNVLDAVVIRDRETGRSRGFGFVTFSNSSEAQSAIRSLNDTEFNGRTIKVDPSSFAYGSAVGGGLYYGYGGSFDGSTGGGDNGNNDTSGKGGGDVYGGFRYGEN